MSAAIVQESVGFGRLHCRERGGEPGEKGSPGLVLIHDVWGISEHSFALAADLAAEGFQVLEIDLYRKLEDREIADPGSFIRSLSDPAILADLDSAADWLRQRSQGERKPGVVGVCMGGTYALLAACLSDHFAAAAPFYGVLSYDEGLIANPDGRDRTRKPHSPLEIGSRLRMPLLAHFGGQDDFVPAEQVERLEASLSAGHQPFEVHTHAEAGHAFLNRTRSDAYHPGASKEAWDRLIPFLRETLSG